MNFGIVRKLIGKIMVLIGVFMILPILVCLIYQEKLWNYMSFLIPSVSMVIIGLLLNIKNASPKMQAKEGLVIVALGWLVISIFGAVPLILSGYYPSFFDALFEITSGFTTTGASITSADLMAELNISGHSILFWRSFSHWIGGMGILVFILGIIPESDEGSSIQILRAESPGPQVGRLTSRMKASSRILYLIYIVLTSLEILLLLVGPNHEMSFFDTLIYAFGTAGTGGFASNPLSVEIYSPYYQYVIATFMFMFGVNFSLYYLILIRRTKEVFKNEELLTYLIIAASSILIISVNIYSKCESFGETFRLAYFQTASIISTTGFSTTDFNNWPTLAKSVLILLMVFGACAGSTAGGLKISRIVIIFKSAFAKVRGMVNPRKVQVIKVNGEVVSNETVSNVLSYTLIYVMVMVISGVLISIDGFDMTTNFSASLACISNIGPGLSVVGPYGSYADFSGFSKIILSLEMIAGRLELFPILILFSRNTWKKM